MFSSDQIVSLSCVSVGVGRGDTNMLAWIGLVDYRGNNLLERYVLPTLPVTDFRTSSTGIGPEHLVPGRAVDLSTAQATVAELIRGKILVGHCLWDDLSVLGLTHLAVATRDVALYQPFRNTLHAGVQSVGLPTLMWQFMSRRFGEEKQHPIETARACLDLYRSAATEWEKAVASGHWPCTLPPGTFSRCYI